MNRILYLLIACFGLIACHSKQEKILSKRWRVADVVFLEDENVLAQNDTLQLSMLRRHRAALEDVLLKNLYEFHQDGTYITGNAAASSTGEWELRGNSIMFKSNSSGDVKSANKTIPFDHLSSDSLVLVFNNDQSSAKMKLVLYPVE